MSRSWAMQRDSQDEEGRTKETEGNRALEPLKVSVTELQATIHSEILARDIWDDKSLAFASRLAGNGRKGFCWSKGLLFRHKVDDLGRNIRQLCLPESHRSRCMELAHERFGHRRKEKCTLDILRYFYWLTVWKDVAHYCRSCEVCQRMSKARPKPCPMKKR